MYNYNLYHNYTIKSIQENNAYLIVILACFIGPFGQVFHSNLGSESSYETNHLFGQTY